MDNVQGGVDECQKVDVSVEKLRELRDLVQQVLDDPNNAPNILPTRQGFFFGSYGYDEWFFEDMKKTARMLDEVFKHHKPNDWYTYQSSW